MFLFRITDSRVSAREVAFRGILFSVMMFNPTLLSLKAYGS